MKAVLRIALGVVLLGLGREASADEWLAKCNAGEANACAVAIQQLITAEQWDQAEALLLQSCSRFGTCNSYSLVNAFQFTGQDERGIKLATRACDEGDMGMCSTLAYWASLGYLVPRDPARAVVLLDRACNNGQTDAMVSASACQSLAMLLRYEEGVSRDEGRAAVCESRARVLEERWRAELAKMQTATVAAVEGWERDCGSGKAAMCSSAAVYLVKLGHLERAANAAWYECKATPASCQGLRIAAEGLARAGRATEGVKLLRERCDAGSSHACEFLAAWLAEGRYGQRDLVEAERLARPACDSGQRCQALVTVLQMTGRGAEARKLSIEILTKARATVDATSRELHAKQAEQARVSKAKAAEEARLAAEMQPYLDALQDAVEERKAQEAQRRPLDRLSTFEIDDLRSRDYRTKELKRLSPEQAASGQAWIQRREARRAALQAFVKELGLSP